jgi:membrane protease YdiL (CAAX protease family)
MVPAAPPPNPVHRIKARWILIGWLAALFVVFAILLLLLPPERLGSLIVGGLTQFGALAIVLVVIARRAGMRWEWLFGSPLEPRHAPLLAIVLPVMAVALGSFTLLWGPLSYVFPRAVESWPLGNMPEFLTPGDPARIAIETLIIVVVAPVMEEVLFRGVLLHRWAHRWGLRAGIILTSLAFGILHVEPIGHFLFGVVLCTLYLTTGSLWAPIAAHALNNALALGGVIPGALRGEPTEKVTLEQLRTDWGQAALIVTVGMVVTVWFLRRYLRVSGVVMPYMRRFEEPEGTA